MVAVAEKAVLRVVDLLDWMVPLHNLNWERGAKSVATRVRKWRCNVIKGSIHALEKF